MPHTATSPSSEIPDFVPGEDDNAMAPMDPTFGGRCLDDGQCDDGIACTFDACDLELQRCRFTPDDQPCQDGVYCNGAEVCWPKLGCRSGDVVSCDDQSPCTVDECEESSGECLRELRDLDADGDPDAHCVTQGGDCDDQNPGSSSLVPELCRNGVDDNCDGQTDEEVCTLVSGDVCESSLRVERSQTLELSLLGAQSDVLPSCAARAAPDGVIELRLDEPADVVIVARSSSRHFGIALSERCSGAEPELSCSVALDAALGEAGPRTRVLRLKQQPAGSVWLWVWDSSAEQVELEIEIAEPGSAPEHETCDTARPLQFEEPQRADLRGVADDLPSRCAPQTGELVYRVQLDEPADLEVFAVARDPAAEAQLSLWRSGCSVGDELSCGARSAAPLFARNLSAGTYFVSVSASSATQVELLARVSPPSPAPASDLCTEPQELGLNAPLHVEMLSFADDQTVSCAAAGRDAFFELRVDEPSDLLLKARTTPSDSVALALSEDACDAAAPQRCINGQASPVRAALHNIKPGQYYLQAESELGNPMELMVAARPARAPVQVLLADTCEQALEIPQSGGAFVGSTAQAGAEWSASCDRGGFSVAGARDQLLKLELKQTRRVILDTAGSDYRTVLNLRRGEQCPGDEVPFGCVPAATGASGSYVEQVLEPDTYWIQVDGFAEAEGRYRLEVFILEP